MITSQHVDHVKLPLFFPEVGLAKVANKNARTAAPGTLATGFLISTLAARPLESLARLGMASLGIPLYLYWRKARALSGYRPAAIN